ncbi:MAG TPA: universal stress protein [Noviherbaspirillum sp.]|nr:universal stress protein [Noviherbaspirillum sp.]
MSYKTILVHVDDAKGATARIELAARLALLDDAHLIGSAMTGVSRYLIDAAMANAGMASIEPYLDALRQRTERTLVPFEEAARRLGVRSIEKRTTDDDATSGLALQARYCDLLVLGQYDPDGQAPPTYANLPEYAAINGGAPVLIVPYSGDHHSAGRRALVAWNGSIEAAKAVRSALPLLRRAEMVEVAVFNPATQGEAHGEQPGADIALYLARHGIRVDVLQEATHTDVGDALLSLAANLNSDLLVMGCYGHSRFREVLLGGATRTMLRTMTLPVLMEH